MQDTTSDKNALKIFIFNLGEEGRKANIVPGRQQFCKCL